MQLEALLWAYDAQAVRFKLSPTDTYDYLYYLLKRLPDITKRFKGMAVVGKKSTAPGGAASVAQECVNALRILKNNGDLVLNQDYIDKGYFPPNTPWIDPKTEFQIVGGSFFNAPDYGSFFEEYPWNNTPGGIGAIQHQMGAVLSAHDFIIDLESSLRPLFTQGLIPSENHIKNPDGSYMTMEAACLRAMAPLRLNHATVWLWGLPIRTVPVDSVAASSAATERVVRAFNAALNGAHFISDAHQTPAPPATHTAELRALESIITTKKRIHFQILVAPSSRNGMWHDTLLDGTPTHDPIRAHTPLEAWNFLKEGGAEGYGIPLFFVDHRDMNEVMDEFVSFPL